MSYQMVLKPILQENILNAWSHFIRASISRRCFAFLLPLLNVGKSQTPLWTKQLMDGYFLQKIGHTHVQVGNRCTSQVLAGTTSPSSPKSRPDQHTQWPPPTHPHEKKSRRHCSLPRPHFTAHLMPHPLWYQEKDSKVAFPKMAISTILPTQILGCLLLIHMQV